MVQEGCQIGIDQSNELGPEPIGYFGFKSIDEGEAEFFIVIGETQHWRKSYGRIAMLNLYDWGFRDLGLRLIYPNVLGNNERALGFYRSLGFNTVGSVSDSEFGRGGKIYSLIRVEITRRMKYEDNQKRKSKDL